MDKKELRNKQKALLAAFDRPEYEHKSFLIASELYKTEEWAASHTIALTVSNFPEVDTWQIIRKAWEEDKRVLVPKCSPKDRRLDFYQLDSFADLEKVYFGLLEPDPDKCILAEKDMIDLVIVPGLAFMRSGYRLGFGGGYYDRFLANYQGRTLSLAFHEQVVKEVPVEHFDIPVGKIITEGAVLNCE
ncbi:5-formyltetrahydrofolate cyclo-ligase [Bacillus sp. P14.5]|uniref:5-formyltetrahydrofolate cyclo-ligase n=1 Tax=Bacillus sp. P14.5 TaxID=1983400 RepID=UPI000DE91241|nr:5-formyltetrahydrofolate cyclo-ligase [Bacillus sp. P14.5]